MNIVYGQFDGKDRLIAVRSDEQLDNISGWEEIDRGEGDKYKYALSNYLDSPICDDFGIFRWKKSPEGIFLRTNEEMSSDYADISEEPTLEERLEANELVADMAYVNSEIALAILEEL